MPTSAEISAQIRADMLANPATGALDNAALTAVCDVLGDAIVAGFLGDEGFATASNQELEIAQLEIIAAEVTGVATEAKQDTQQTTLEAIEAALAPVATEVTLASVLGALVDVATATLQTAGNTILGAIRDRLPAALVGGRLDVNVGAALPVGTNNIGDVDVLTLPAIPAGTNNIGDVDVLTLPAIPAGTNNIGDVDVASIAAGDNVVGRVKLTDGTDVAEVTAANALKTDGSAVVQPISAASLPLPAGAATEAKQGTTFDLDSGAGSQPVAGVSLRKAASGGSVELGTSADPIRVDPTGTTTQPVSVAALPLPAGAATEATLDSIVYAPGEAPNKVVALGAVRDDTGTAASGEDVVYSLRLTPWRALHTNLRNASGTEIGTAVNPLRIDPTNTTAQDVVVQTMPVVQIAGIDVHGDPSTDPNPINIGGVASSAVPTAVSGGDAVRAYFDPNGYLGTFSRAEYSSGDAIGKGLALAAVFDNTGSGTLAEDTVGPLRCDSNRVLYTDIRSNNVRVPVTDNGGFNDGSSQLMLAGFVFDEVAGTALTENDAAAARIDSKRAIILTLEDETTRGRRLTISAEKAALVAGDTAHDAADAGSPVKVGGKAAVSALPTAVANGDRANLATDRYGRLLVREYDHGMFVSKTIGTYTTAQTGVALWTPASGKIIKLKSLRVSVFGTTTGRMTFWYGASGDTTYTEGTDQLVYDNQNVVPSAYGSWDLVINFPDAEPCLNVDYILRLTTSTNISLVGVATGYEVTP